jgi:hypothetical protein
MSVITMPTSPAAPDTIEITLVDPTAMTQSPFTGQQTAFSWGAGWLECSVSMPALTVAQAQEWFTFLRALNGQANTFTFTSPFISAYSWMLQSGGSSIYWRLKSNSRKISLSHQRVFGLQFDAIQVL